MKALVVAVALVALVGCGPTQDRNDPAGVQEVEDIVNDLQSVVGSAESEADSEVAAN